MMRKKGDNRNRNFPLIQWYILSQLWMCIDCVQSAVDAVRMREAKQRNNSEINDLFQLISTAIFQQNNHICIAIWFAFFIHSWCIFATHFSCYEKWKMIEFRSKGNTNILSIYDFSSRFFFCLIKILFHVWCFSYLLCVCGGELPGTGTNLWFIVSVCVFGMPTRCWCHVLFFLLFLYRMRWIVVNKYCQWSLQYFAENQ